jgi:hypothetical protein
VDQAPCNQKSNPVGAWIVRQRGVARPTLSKSFWARTAHGAAQQVISGNVFQIDWFACETASYNEDLRATAARVAGSQGSLGTSRALKPLQAQVTH